MFSRRVHIDHSARFSPVLSLAVIAIAAFGAVTGCGGSDDDSDTPSASQVDEGVSGADASAASDAGADEVDAPAPGSGSGTLSLSDGMTYSFDMSTCDTSENGADGFVVPDSYDLFGTTADGAFTVQLIRAGLDEDFIVETAGLEGNFDENGKNAGILYTKVVDTLALKVDGGDVSGTVSLSPIGPNRPHGDQIDATVDVSC